MAVDPNLFANLTPPNAQPEGGDLTPEQLLTLIDRQTNRHETRMARKEMFYQRELERLLNQKFKLLDAEHTAQSKQWDVEDKNVKYRQEQFEKTKKGDEAFLREIKKDISPFMKILKVSDSKLADQIEKYYFQKVYDKIDEMSANYSTNGFKESDKNEIRRMINSSGFGTFMNEYVQHNARLDAFKKNISSLSRANQIVQTITQLPKGYMDYNYVDSNEVDRDTFNNALGSGDEATRLQAILHPPHKKTDQIDFANGAWAVPSDELNVYPTEKKPLTVDELWEKKYKPLTIGGLGLKGVTPQRAGEIFDELWETDYGKVTTGGELPDNDVHKKFGAKDWELEWKDHGNQKLYNEMKDLEKKRHDIGVGKFNKTNGAKRLAQLNQMVTDYKHNYIVNHGASAGMLVGGAADKDYRINEMLYATMGEEKFTRYIALSNKKDLTTEEQKELKGLQKEAVDAYNYQHDLYRKLFVGQKQEEPVPPKAPSTTTYVSPQVYVSPTQDLKEQDFNLNKGGLKYNKKLRYYFGPVTNNRDELFNHVISDKNQKTYTMDVGGNQREITMVQPKNKVVTFTIGQGTRGQKTLDGLYNAFADGGHNIILNNDFTTQVDPGKNKAYYTCDVWLSEQAVKKQLSKKAIDDLKRRGILIPTQNADRKDLKMSVPLNGYIFHSTPTFGFRINWQVDAAQLIKEQGKLSTKGKSTANYTG